MTMRVRLGKTELFINPVGLGTNYVGGHNIYPDADEEAGRELLRTGINNGLNFIDTAFMYGPKRSEELIGEVVKELGVRSEVVIATKASYKFVGKDVVHDNSPSFLKQSVEDSLQRLQTDYIDLFYIHFPDKDTSKDEAVGVLKKLKDEGKIRAIGVSNFSIDQLKEANKDGHVDVYQGEYNLINRSAEIELFPYALQHGISYVPYFPLASGLLTGKYDLNTDVSGKRGKYFKEGVYERNIQKVERIRKIAQEKGVEVSHIVLAWYLSRDAIDAIIPGAKKAEQVLRNLRTLEVNLTKDEIDQIDQNFKELI
ncbi:aldo/keto reductase [Bacillus sp. EB01]|uniref:aldo/keto reductase n=1 Tax=Bacillus sp. EB01 TaxID=1347086 RepID=UPI0005C6CC7D|nr:aldo/keto reductase [Bacillus sp. EB01]